MWGGVWLRIELLSIVCQTVVVNILKEQAIRLRIRGYSYSMIRSKIGLSKSTLSNWLGRIPFEPNKEVLERVGSARLKSALYKQSVKREDIRVMSQKAFKDIGKLSKRDLFMLGIGLYLGEGSKAFEEIRIVNSDPNVIRLSILWLITCCQLSIKNLRIAIHCYPDNNEKELIKFWHKETKIPLKQFVKTSIDLRTNKSKVRKRKLPFGTAHLYVVSASLLPLGGVKSRHRRIMGWIEASSKKINAGFVYR